MKSNAVNTVSVIIPAYYSSRTLAGCLDALRRQTFRGSIEVFVVNSSPEKDTTRVAADYPEVRLIQSQERLLPHEARNLGAELARGDLLVFTDPDCEADPDWLQRLVTACNDGWHVLAGAMELKERNFWEQGVHLMKFHWLLSELPAGFRFCAPTANAAYSRALWRQVGPFPDGYFAGDGMLSHRAIRAGHLPRFVPDAIVRHRHLDSAAGLLRQRFHRGKDYAKAQLLEMHLGRRFLWPRLLFSWAALPWVVLRAARDAFRCGWGEAFLMTLPIQTAGHLLWALGESWGSLGLAFRLVAGAKGKAEGR